MALIKCKDCGKEFSTDAKVCPHCGAKKTKAKTRWKSILITIGVIYLIGLLSPHSGSSTPNTPTQEEIAQEAKANAEKAEYNKKKEGAKNFALVSATELRKTMRNPSSLKFDSVFVTNAGDVCYDYRAENGFGGMNHEYAILTKNAKFYQNNSSKWNKLCVNKEGYEVSSFINIYMSNLN